MGKIKKVRSIWRYVGGKSRSLKLLDEFINISHKSYKEPFLGGGSVFLYKNKAEKNWINDLDEDVYYGWIAMRDFPDKLIEYFKEYTPPTLERYHEVKNTLKDEIAWKGFRGIYLNRTSFNGMIHSCPIGGKFQTGKWKVDACWKNVDDLIKRVKDNNKILQGVKITCLDFEEIIKEPGEDVLMFLDPVYFERNALYQVGMTVDDHERLRKLLLETKHNFILTYKDCPEVRELYKNKDKFIILEKSWTYSMMSMGKNGCQKGNELFILNKNFPFKIEIKNKFQIKNLKEGDIFRTKKNNKGQLLKKLDNNKYLLKNLDNEKEYEISLKSDKFKKIIFNCDKIKGEFEITGLNNQEFNETGDRFEKWDNINDYHLSNDNGMLRIYEGKYEPHYYHYVKNGEIIQLKKEDFLIK